MPRSSASGCGVTGDGSPVVGTVVITTSSTSCSYAASATPSSSLSAGPLCCPKAGDGPWMRSGLLENLYGRAQEHPLAQLALRRVLHPLQEVAAPEVRVVVDVAARQHGPRRDAHRLQRVHGVVPVSLRCPGRDDLVQCAVVLPSSQQRGEARGPKPAPAVPLPGTASATASHRPPTA